MAASLGLVAGVGSPASARPARAPSVAVQQIGIETVQVTGRTATRKARVRFHQRTSAGWSFVKRVRAHRHHYTTTLSVSAGRTVTFKVTSNHRSRRFVVSMPAAKVTAPAVSKPKSTPASTDACGVQPRKPDGSLWSCTFDDEFSGTELDRTKWVVQGTYSGDPRTTYACYRDDPSNVDVADGSLSLTLRKLDSAATCPFGLPPTTLVSGGISTFGIFSQQYGRFEARIKNTASGAPGLHEAFWLWPDKRYSTIAWPGSGEIDIAETYSDHNDIVLPYLHYSADAGGVQFGVNTNPCAAARGVWNTYTLEWNASRIEILVNGKTCLVNTSGDPAFQKRYIINLNQAIGPIGNMPTDATTFPATTQVDYVRAWQ
jgi:beta-glucanase (GH16 family)